MLKIETTRSTPTEITYRLCGELTAEGLPTLRDLLDDCARRRRAVTLDLAELTRADRECVELLASGPGRRARIVHCPRVPARVAPRRAGSATRGARPGSCSSSSRRCPARAAAAQELTLSLSDAVARALSDGTAARIAGEQVVTASTQATAGEVGAASPARRARSRAATSRSTSRPTGSRWRPGQSPVVGPFNVLDLPDVGRDEHHRHRREEALGRRSPGRRGLGGRRAAHRERRRRGRRDALRQPPARRGERRDRARQRRALHEAPRSRRRPAPRRRRDEGGLDARQRGAGPAAAVADRRREPARRGAPRAPPRDRRRPGARRSSLADRLRESDEAAPRVAQALAAARQDRPGAAAARRPRPWPRT